MFLPVPAALNLVRFLCVRVAGYFEDRRPASNMDPYVVTSLIAETTILWEPSHSNGNGVAAA